MREITNNKIPIPKLTRRKHQETKKDYAQDNPNSIPIAIGTQFRIPLN